MVAIERSQRIVLARHAETEWSRSGRHTGRTDLELTAAGRDAAVLLGARLRHRRFDHAGSSPLQRAVTTAHLAGFDDPVIDDDLLEWDYGDYEGVTTAEIRRERPGWELWVDGAPNGESPEEVSERADAAVERATRRCADGFDSIVFGHGHMLTAMAVRWVGLPIADGRHLRISTGSIAILRWKRENRVIDLWNDRSHLTDPLADTD
ncbi:histidine phosphatase family protein [Ilumatobacter nonamiensis]|uniref:histidine phosphatase family protein n=1 Tax=Ilumatobacter nonamiensis TaxID=467093 RepID=UPI0005904A5D|nr:histidine phosphatase family protein [Ilumatobacter nonamiensis]